ncbi:MAG: hypothetical protein ACI8W7_004830 [Gammaproteobacteria bacterium]|jgi:hypothetical protein
MEPAVWRGMVYLVDLSILCAEGPRFKQAIHTAYSWVDIVSKRSSSVWFFNEVRNEY